MSRKNREEAAHQAAERASEAGRVLQEQRQNTQETETVETTASEATETHVRLGPRNEPRTQGMEDILAKRAEQQAEPAESESAQEMAPRQGGEEPAKVEGETTPALESAGTEPEKPATVKVKVDGEEFEVPQSDVDDAGSVAAYQRERAAENRLRKTNEALAETRKVQAEIAGWIAQNTPKPVVETDDQFIASRMDTIRFGSPEDSAKAMMEVMHRTNQRIDPEAMTNMAVMRMQENQAISEFKKEFEDVVANPLLLKLASTLENERKAQLKQVPDWSNFYRTIGNEVRSVMGRQNQSVTTQQQQQAPGGNTSQTDKEARKASIVNLPMAAARATTTEATKPETRQDVLNAMRAKRGIPTG